MVGIILTGHGEFAPGLASAISMVAGEQESFEVVPFAGDKPEEFASKLRESITQMAQQTDGVMVYCDLLGGTPFNQAMLISADVANVQVICGANLPSVIEPLFARASSTLDELVAQAIVAGQGGLSAQSMAALSTDVPEDSDFEDGI